MLLLCWATAAVSVKRLRKLRALRMLQESLAMHDFELRAEDWCLSMAAEISAMALHEELAERSRFSLRLGKLLKARGFRPLLLEVASEYCAHFGSQATQPKQELQPLQPARAPETPLRRAEKIWPAAQGPFVHIGDTGEDAVSASWEDLYTE